MQKHFIPMHTNIAYKYLARDDSWSKTMCEKCIFIVDSVNRFKDQWEMVELKLKRDFQEASYSENFTDGISYYTMYNSSAITKTEDPEQYEIKGKKIRKKQATLKTLLMT